MLFQVRIGVSIPPHLPEQERARLLAEERHRAQDLQRQGVGLHLWRVVGCYSNISIFDVDSNDALHEVLWTLPLFPFMQVEVTPLARHPSATRPADVHPHHPAQIRHRHHQTDSGARHNWLICVQPWNRPRSKPPTPVGDPASRCAREPITHRKWRWFAPGAQIPPI